ncbi:tail tape measure protein [Escherichia phage vB_EcoS_SCS92]|uniref:tail tape measure protein n=1 Tax=Escherichia phage NTEC3 TaxID=2885687 RepID=UPI001E786B43|nr:tail tape measure protein [Escherichia phage NTEC3]UDG73301.1 tail tape measure protein [Escherichia phage NTEC3]UTQ72490.1 tail tape measure protein [Escherichia phage vB_EcoS_SCS92]
MADTASLIARVKTEGADVAAKQLDAMASSADRADTAVNKLTPDVNKVNSATSKAASDGFAKFRNAAGQVGFQVQDMVVQLQSGTSAFVAIGQQGSQLAGAFGPGGAVLGAVIALASAVGGVLYKSLTEAEGSSKDLEAAQKQLKDTFQQTASGSLELTDGLIQLTQISREAAETQLALAKANADLIAQQTAKAVREDAESWETWKASTASAISQYDALVSKGADVGDTLEKLGGTYEGNIVGVNMLAQNIAELSSKFGVNRDQALEMIAAQSAFNKEPTAENARRIADVFTDWLGNTKQLNPELIRLTDNANKNATALENAEKSANAAAEAQKNLGRNVNSTTQRFQEQNDAIVKNQQIAILSDRERIRAQAELDKQAFAKREAVTKEQIAAYNAARDTEAQQDIARIDKTEKEKADREAKSNEKRLAAQAKREETAAERQKKAAEDFLATVDRTTGDEISRITAAEEQKLAKLEEFNRAGTISQQQYENAKTQIMLTAEQARQEELDKKRKEQQEKQQKGEDFMAQIMGQNATELELLDIQEQQKLKVADKYREQGLISEKQYQAALNAINEQYATKRADATATAFGNMASNIGSALGEASGAYKAFAIVQATIATYTAAIEAYKSTAAIPVVGPFLAPVAAAAAVGAGMAQISAIRSAREQGGQLSAGQASTIAERGKPEVIMPAGASRVRTAQQMKEIMGQNGSSSGPSNVTIVNNTSSQIGNVSTEQDDEGRLRIIIEEQVAASLQNSNSKISKARKATRNAPGFK